MLRALDRHQDALAGYDRALALAPEEVPALSGRAAVLVALKRPEDALACLDRLLTLDPSDADALSNRGFLLQSLNRYDEALASLDRALEVDPDHAGALNNRGMVLLDLGRPAAAVESYRRALAIKPTPGCHSNLIFALNFDPDADAHAHRAERVRWGEQHAEPFAANDPAASEGRPTPSGGCASVTSAVIFAIRPRPMRLRVRSCTAIPPPSKPCVTPMRRSRTTSANGYGTQPIRGGRSTAARTTRLRRSSVPTASTSWSIWSGT